MKETLLRAFLKHCTANDKVLLDDLLEKEDFMISNDFETDDKLRIYDTFQITDWEKKPDSVRTLDPNKGPIEDILQRVSQNFCHFCPPGADGKPAKVESKEGIWRHFQRHHKNAPFEGAPMRAHIRLVNRQLNFETLSPPSCGYF